MKKPPPAASAPRTGGGPARAEPSAPGRAAGRARADERLPGQSPNRAAWKYAVLAAIFLAWLAFLIYCAVGGNG